MNSIAKLMNRELYNMTLAMLIYANMPVTFWEDDYQVVSMKMDMLLSKMLLNSQLRMRCGLGRVLGNASPGYKSPD